MEADYDRFFLAQDVWDSRHAAAALALTNVLRPSEAVHFSQVETAKGCYDAIIACHSTPSSSSLMPPPHAVLAPRLFEGCAAPQPPTFIATRATAAVSVFEETASVSAASWKKRGKGGKKGGKGGGGGGVGGGGVGSGSGGGRGSSSGPGGGDPGGGTGQAGLPGGVVAASGGACVAALGACVATRPGAPPVEASLSFTLNSGASQCFFYDHTTLTPPLAPFPVALADPTSGPAIAHSSTTLPCLVVPFGVLRDLHIPSFTRNLVGVGYLQDRGIIVTILGHGRTVVCMDNATGAVLATFNGEPRSAPRAGLERERYFLVVVVDFSRHTMMFPLAKNSEVTSTLIRWLLATEDTHGHRVSCLHSDREGEFRSDVLAGFCGEHGIRQSWTLPESPQQNGVAERRIGLVMEIAGTSMIHARVPHFLWPYAVRYAAHQLNLWPRVSRPGASPTSLWTRSPGVVSEFHVWGCLALVHDTSADKLSARAIPSVFLDFPVDSPDFTFYHPPLHHFLDSRDVRFDESVSYYARYGCQGLRVPLPPPPLFLATSPPPRDRPSSPFGDVRTVLFRSSLRHALHVSILPPASTSSLTVSSHPITDYYRSTRHVVSRALASLVTDPRASPSSVSALTAARFLDFLSAGSEMTGLRWCHGYAGASLGPQIVPLVPARSALALSCPARTVSRCPAAMRAPLLQPAHRAPLQPAHHILQHARRALLQPALRAPLLPAHRALQPAHHAALLPTLRALLQPARRALLPPVSRPAAARTSRPTAALASPPAARTSRPAAACASRTAAPHVVPCCCLRVAPCCPAPHAPLLPSASRSAALPSVRPAALSSACPAALQPAHRADLPLGPRALPLGPRALPYSPRAALPCPAARAPPCPAARAPATQRAARAARQLPAPCPHARHAHHARTLPAPFCCCCCY
ncbi:unnamed protein product [Closterium sp. NIES-54]